MGKYSERDVQEIDPVFYWPLIIDSTPTSFENLHIVDMENRI